MARNKEHLKRWQHVEFARDLGKDLLANPMLSQSFSTQKGGISLESRRNPSDDSIGDVYLLMSSEQRRQAGGTFKWHPFHNALRLNGWEEADKHFYGILAGGWVEWKKKVEFCTWTLRLNDHPSNWWEHADVRWDTIGEARPLELWTHRATLYEPVITY